MSYADECFKYTAEQVLEHGFYDADPRAHWADGSPAYAKSMFGFAVAYDLSKEFPALTLRKTNIKAAFDEILWIYQKKSNNVKDLHSHIWDQWMDDQGTIGKAYGYQVAKKINKIKIDPDMPDEEINSLLIDLKGKYPSAKIHHTNRSDMKNSRWVRMDQMDSVLYDLENDSFSRRIMISLYNPSELHEMNLQPCCWSINFNVTQNARGEKTLNGVLNQRSNDILTANNWNVVQYALLLMMLAQVNHMKVGNLLHVITNAHIYDRHEDLVDELINRPTYDAPTVTLNPKIDNFYDFSVNDLTIENYSAGEQMRFEVAI